MDFDEVAFLKKHGVTLYFDVGANIGYTGTRLRKGGFSGRIVSFEPIPRCYATLQATAQADATWETHNCAIGDLEGLATIGISANLVSSSLRPATEDLIKIHEPIRYTDYEDGPVRRLDGLIPGLIAPGDKVYLKVDTQGFERNVVLGAGAELGAFAFVRLEVAVREVYLGEMELPEAITLMSSLGFTLIEAWPAWRHPETDDVLHFDLLFRRNSEPQ